MKTTLHTALATLALFGSRGFGDDNPTATPATPERADREQSPAEREATILHEWPGTVPLGFNAQRRLLVFDSGRRVFEVHDLAATNAAITGWDQPEDGGRVFGGTLSSDRRRLATLAEVGKKQSRLQLWNAETGERMGPAFAPSDVAHVAFSPDGKTLAGVVALDGAVRVWDAATGELRGSMSLPQPMQVTWIGLQFSPDGRFLAARNSYAFQIWDLTKRQVAGSGDQAFYQAISRDWKLALGFTLKSGAQQPPRTGLLDLADPNQPAPAKALPDDLLKTMDMGTFSPDGRFLALSLRDQSVRVWDLAAARVVRQTATTEGRIIRLLVSPDNRRLATYEIDLGRQRSLSQGNVRLWDLATGQALSPARPHHGMFWDWQFDPDSRFLVVCLAQGNDVFGTQIWRLPPGGTAEATVAEPAKSGRAATPPAAPGSAPGADAIDIWGERIRLVAPPGRV